MMRRKNIGKISFIVVLVNVLWISVYICDKYEIIDKFNQANLSYTETTENGNKIYNVEVKAYCDSLISPTDANKCICQLKEKMSTYEIDEVKVLTEYQWYLALDDTKSFQIDNKMVYIYYNDSFVQNIDLAIKEILSVSEVGK